MRKGAFNTGRQYSDKGQRIAWVLVSEYVIFADVDRGISGEFKVLFGNTDLVTDRFVLNQYDNLMYTDKTYDLVVRELEKTARAL